MKSGGRLLLVGLSAAAALVAAAVFMPSARSKAQAPLATIISDEEQIAKDINAEIIDWRSMPSAIGVTNSSEGFLALRNRADQELNFAIIDDRAAPDELRNEAMNCLRHSAAEKLCDRLIALTVSQEESERMRSFAMQHLSLLCVESSHWAPIRKQILSFMVHVLKGDGFPGAVRRDALLALARSDKSSEVLRGELRSGLNSSDDQAWVKLCLRISEMIKDRTNEGRIREIAEKKTSATAPLAAEILGQWNYQPAF